MNVGIFFKVAGSFLIDSVSLETGEPYGDAIQYGGHYCFHESCEPATVQERRFKSHDYDYYPRGRVVYLPKRNTFILYIDPCLTNDDVQQIACLFGLVGQPVEVTGDEHYRCSGCNAFYVE